MRPVQRSAAAKAGAGFVIVFRQAYRVGREKFSYGEGDAAEQRAGIFAASAGAFFFGHAVIIDGNKQLGIPLQTDNGELPQCHIDPTGIIAAAEVTSKAAVYAGRYFAQRTIGTGAVSVNAGIQKKGFYSFYNSYGKIALFHQLGIAFAGMGAGGENFGAAFTAKENGALIKDAKAFHRDRHRCAETCLQSHGVEKSHIHAVESAVEMHRLYIYIDMQELGGAALDGKRAVDGVHVLAFGVKTEILQTIFIPAGVKNLFGVDAYRLADAAAALNGAGDHFIGHG
jgi:hypothetical protein